MATPFKILLIVSALLAAIVIAVSAFILTLDLEEYRDDITRLLRDETGLDFQLRGEIGFTLWPSISLVVEDVAADWDDATQQPLVAVERIEFETALLAALVDGGDLTIENILLRGVALDLRIDADGHDNWTPPDMTARSSDDTSAEMPATADASDPEVQLDLTLSRFEIADLSVRYRDASAGTDVELSGLDVTAIDDGDNRTVLNLGGRVTVVDGPQVAFGGALTLHQDTLELDIESLTADVDMAAWPQTLPIRLTGKIRRDDATTELDQLRAEVGEVRLQLDGTVATADADTELDLRLVIDNSDLRAMLSRIDALPATSDPAALTRLSGAIDLQGSTRALRMRAMNVNLDALKFTGSADYRALDDDRVAIEFDFDAGRVDLLPYLAAAEAPAQDAPSGPLVSDEPLDLAALRSLDIDGELDADALILPGVALGASGVDMDMRGGRINLDVTAQGFLGGNLGLDLEADARTDTLTAAARIHAEEVDAGRLAPEFGFTGKLALDGNLDARGVSSAALANTLDGQIDLTGSPGRVNVAALRGALLPLAQLLGRGEKISSWPDELGYQSLTGTWRVTQGLPTQDLRLAIDNLRIDATGGLRLDAEAFDFRAGAVFASETPRTFDVPEELDGIRLPARCAGNMADEGNPCGFDQQATGRLVTQILTSRAAEPLRQNLTEQLPEELRAPAEQLLRGLFGQPRSDNR